MLLTLKSILMTVVHSDCLEYMKGMAANSVDFIVTDPPYGLKFMGKEWDHGIPGAEFWREALRICKPGSFILAFGGTRTYHRLTCAIEDAGWEIRDCIMWIYGSGFPKSHNHFGIEGYGTALKPAHEPIIMAMKPIDSTFKQNAEKWGLAGINIDDCRIGTHDTRSKCSLTALGQNSGWNNHENKEVMGGSQNGRWPANVIFDEEAGAMLDEQSGFSKSSAVNRKTNPKVQRLFRAYKEIEGEYPHLNDSGGASRFFYCAKASSAERNAGLEEMPFVEKANGNKWTDQDYRVPEKTRLRQNHHPTVKPLKLMEYLIKLIAPPGNPILLDPFCGSGSTLVAAQKLGIRALGIEREESYVKIARERLREPAIA